MSKHEDKQIGLSVLEMLQSYTSERIERALGELDLTEECIVLQLGCLEIHWVRRVTRSRRRWSRWVSLFGVIVAFIAAILQVWLTS
jgi:hypothetical protein